MQVQPSTAVRRLTIAILLAAAAVLGGRFALDGGAQPLDGTVTRVVDGDTLHVRLAGRDETVRLLGIDTPELHRPGTPVECGARAAASVLQRAAEGRRVSVRADPTQDERDRYGRMLGYVETADGRDLGEAVVEAGWAEVYVFDRHAFARVARYREAARRARTAGRGVRRRCNGDFHSAS